MSVQKQIKSTIATSKGRYVYFSLKKLARLGFFEIESLPFSIKVLLENALRHHPLDKPMGGEVERLACWPDQKEKGCAQEISFFPGRVILQDFTGVPCVVDLAAMRDAMRRLGGDFKKINPQVPCDLIIDHSVQTDFSASKDAFTKNLAKEFQRNKERYAFLKWGQNTFKNFRVIPPAMGIIHQINLEYLAQGVFVKKCDDESLLYPDTVVGTDSHTTMVNALGVLGWGVGGIEAEAVMLGEPLNMVIPEVVGVHLKGSLPRGIMPTDLVLTIVEILRKHGVVGKFVEYFGSGLSNLSLANRAMIANMAPEYGATMGFFPVDQETIRYYRQTGRKKDHVDLIEQYYKSQGMFYRQGMAPKRYTQTIEINLKSIRLSMAGPKRPQDRVLLSQLKEHFLERLKIPAIDSIDRLQHGSVVIASITSCTNTSDPFVLIAAGLLAKNAVLKGLKVKPFVKTSLAPGSRVVFDYLKKLGLLNYLEKLGFHIAGYGCMTCIGNSGPLDKKISDAIQSNKLIVASVLSGNRNFEGRVHPMVKENFLASPPLVIAYALAGNIGIDLTTEPIGKDAQGQEVYLSDLWPDNALIERLITKGIRQQAFQKCYANVSQGTAEWKKIKSISSDLYPWKTRSTYIQPPPFFDDIQKNNKKIEGLTNARVLAVLGDSVTTDHISPAGLISENSPAGQYLLSLQVNKRDFNSYGSRRGNDQVMTRGTFANIRLRNHLVPNTEGGWTRHFPTNKEMSIYDAAVAYKEQATPLIIIAGKEYGTGSSRDWAAKGTALLGVKAVIAQSFERIHRSNLAGMGVLPLEFLDNQSLQTLDLKGDEIFDIDLNDQIKPAQHILVSAKDPAQQRKNFYVKLRLDTPAEIHYYRCAGILPSVLLQLSS